MKFFTFAVLVLFMTVRAFADCAAMEGSCDASYVAKKEAIQARDKGDLVTAAAKYQEAATLMPLDIYKALDLLNAEGCLVGSWSPSKGYIWNDTQGAANKVAAQALLDQVQELLDTIKANKCKYKNGSIALATGWLANAQDALNGKFH